LNGVSAKKEGTKLNMHSRRPKTSMNFNSKFMAAFSEQELGPPKRRDLEK